MSETHRATSLHGCAPTQRSSADEIERLRAALMFVAGLPGTDPLIGQLAVTAARAALKGANLAEKS
jgi:hypothetical protein